MQPRPLPATPALPPALPMVGAALLFASMALLAKRVAARLPGPEIAFVRFLVGLVGCGVAATRYRLRARNRWGLFMRGAFGGAAVLCYFLAIEHLPVGEAALINYTAPVFTAIWAALFLHEPIGLKALAALLLTASGVAGVIVGQAPPGMGAIGPWELVAMLSAVLSGAALTTVRLVRKTDGTWEIFAAFCAIGALVTGVPAMGRWVAPSATEWAWLVVIGLLALAGQILMTYAFRFLRAAVAGILMLLTPAAALALGHVLYGERIGALALAGAAVTLAGVSWGAWLAASPAPPDAA